ncbi:hypothetical protein BASA50_005815 [Batrachochytrium salamandrivorans]|uniref:Extracellular metalloproteinase n=1 Tax=Batrachochytrium salamandrivorans TaxID=1357716 RepID=A0ABQ8FEZ1_9FUNG|nr:hypothetical protein BASA50_005815 [Batrachochytrium salamandrivorans]
MVAVSLFLSLALVSSTATAQPGTDGSTEILARFKRQPTFKPPKLFAESVYEWILLGEETPTPPSDQDPADIGLSYILQQLNIQPDEFTKRTNFTDRFGVTHLYRIPLHEGWLIENLHAAVHIKGSQVFFYSATTIVDDHVLTKRSPTIPESTIEKSAEEAVNSAVDYLNVPFYPDIAPVKESYKTENGNILVWKLQLRDNPLTRWIEVKVNANTGVVVSKESFKRKFTYTAIELPNENPYDGFSTVVDPENLQSSPYGWTEGYKLKGNNALVKFKRGKKLKTTAMGMFDGAFDPTLPPQTPKNLVTGAINAFYAANMVHDVLYPYGFNEPAGNFQKDNFKRSGMGGDPVIINLQSSKEKNHVSFDTPPDGQPGVLNLHISTTTNPNRDSALDNTVMIHELTHGLSSRLTGGAQTKMCMSKIESRGLSEGYSDVMAPVFTAKPEDTRNTKKVIAEYIGGDQRGNRRDTDDSAMQPNIRFSP